MDAISSIGKIFSNPAFQTISKLGGLVTGTVGNVLGNNMKNRAVNQELDVQKQLMNLSPGTMASGINALTRPLSGALTSSIGNNVQGQLAERGLSQSPGIFGDVLAQALAPAYLQEQQTATQAYLQKLGLPAAAAARFLPYPTTNPLSDIFKSLYTMGGSGSGTGTGSNPVFTGEGATMPSMEQLMAAYGGMSTNPSLAAGAPYNVTPPYAPSPDDTGSSGGGGFDWMSMLSPNGPT